mmetsp:Transcript_6445/g.24300  ORF Transcript_6445/g.24300 Transcript_6445/m.24300 type:complete len:203 (-) Transcript_6445:213-821(-)
MRRGRRCEAPALLAPPRHWRKAKPRLTCFRGLTALRAGGLLRTKMARQSARRWMTRSGARFSGAAPGRRPRPRKRPRKNPRQSRALVWRLKKRAGWCVLRKIHVRTVLLRLLRCGTSRGRRWRSRRRTKRTAGRRRRRRSATPLRNRADWTKCFCRWKNKRNSTCLTRARWTGVKPKPVTRGWKRTWRNTKRGRLIWRRSTF